MLFRVGTGTSNLGHILQGRCHPFRPHPILRSDDRALPRGLSATLSASPLELAVDGVAPARDLRRMLSFPGEREKHGTAGADAVVTTARCQGGARLGASAEPD